MEQTPSGLRICLALVRYKLRLFSSSLRSRRCFSFRFFVICFLFLGDTVLFTAVMHNGGDRWKTVKWTARGFRIGSDRATLADSYTQTAMSTSEITMRYIAPALGTILCEKPTLRSFLS